MINRIKSFIFHPLFSGSAVMIIGLNAANFIAYIYHLVVGRLLGPSAYGELAATLSLLGMLSALFSFTNLVIVKFVSAGKLEEVKKIFSWFSRKALTFGIPIAILIFALTPVLSSFLHIKNLVLVFVGPILLFFLLTYIYKSFLQGLLRFKEIVIATNSEMLARLIFGLVFIYLGFSSFGTVLGIFIGAIIGFYLTKVFLKQYKMGKSGETFTEGGEVVKYSLPVIFLSVASSSFFSTDVVLVKHFFSSHDAGLYAALSILSKIILFGTAPVASVMFPMVSQRHSKGQSYKKIFITSFLLTGVIAGAVLGAYLFVPKLAVSVLYGKAYFDVIPWLFWGGLSMFIFSLASLMLNLYFSLNKTKVVIFAVIAAVIQVIGIWLFHSSILTVVGVSIASATFLLASLLIFFAYETRK